MTYLYRERIVDDISWSSLANAGDFEEIREALEHTPYSRVIDQFSQERVRKEGLFFLETGLDHIWVTSVLAVLPSLAREDRLIVTSLLDADGDLKNLINIFRYHALWDLPPDQLPHILYPAGQLQYSDDVRRLMEEDIDKETYQGDSEKNDIPAWQKNSKRWTTRMSEHRVQRVEQYLFIMRKEAYRRLLRGNPFNDRNCSPAIFFLSEQQDSVVKRLIECGTVCISERAIPGGWSMNVFTLKMSLLTALVLKEHAGQVKKKLLELGIVDFRELEGLTGDEVVRADTDETLEQVGSILQQVESLFHQVHETLPLLTQEDIAADTEIDLKASERLLDEIFRSLATLREKQKQVTGLLSRYRELHGYLKRKSF